VHRLDSRDEAIDCFTPVALNQGSLGIKELIATVQPEVIMVQEHWLTTDNLFKLNSLYQMVVNVPVKSPGNVITYYG